VKPGKPSSPNAQPQRPGMAGFNHRQIPAASQVF